MTRSPRSHDVSAGMRTGVIAYVLWGLLTIYWKQLRGFSAFELIGWRVMTASIVMAGVVTVQRRWPVIRAAFRDHRLTLRIGIASVLLSANWTAYVYAVVHDRVLETALGYFMAPLGTMILGVTVLKERPSSAQKVAIVLAALAVVELTFAYGRLPIAALTMAVTWSNYGLLKNKVPLRSVESFAAESFLLLVPAAVMIAAFAPTAGSIPRTADAAHLTLVSFAGVATAIPLTLFAYAAPRVPFTILGPLMYLVPSINFALGWLLFGEDLPWTRLLGFSFVWAALVIVTVDRLRSTRIERAAARLPATAD